MSDAKSLAYIDWKANPNVNQSTLAKSVGVTRETVNRWIKGWKERIKGPIILSKKTPIRIPTREESYESHKKTKKVNIPVEALKYILRVYESTYGKRIENLRQKHKLEILLESFPDFIFYTNAKAYIDNL